MPKRSFSGISRGHTAAVKRRRMLGGAKPATIGRSLTAKVNQLINSQELKNSDTSAAAQVTNSTGSMTPLNGNIAAGDDVTQRNGRKINLVSSMLRFHSFITDGVSSAPAAFRLALVYDRQPNGTPPTWTDVFQLQTSDSDRNVSNRDRFTIIYDNYNSAKKGYLSVSPGAAGATGFESGFYDQNYAKLRDMTTEYATTATGTPLHGGLYMALLTDQPGTIRYYHRVTFTDN